MPRAFRKQNQKTVLIIPSKQNNTKPKKHTEKREDFTLTFPVCFSLEPWDLKCSKV